MPGGSELANGTPGVRATARYVESRQRFTPQRLPGSSRLDAGCCLSVGRRSVSTARALPCKGRDGVQNLGRVAYKLSGAVRRPLQRFRRRRQGRCPPQVF